LSLRLVDERFYHLDVCFCPLPGGRAFYYPGAFDHRSLELIRSRFSPEDRHEVSEADALAFACNAVVAGKTVITNAAGVELSARLRDWGFEVVACPVSEFILAGGAVKCLALQATLDFGSGPGLKAGVSDVHDRLVALDGHLLDTGLMSVAMDTITGTGGSFAIEAFQAGLRRESASSARVRVFAPSRQLDEITAHLLRLGATVVEEEVDARLELVAMDGVAPGDFYSTSIYPTDVRVGGGKWHRALAQRMDAVLAVDEPDGGEECAVRCTLMRDLKAGQKVVCGVAGIRTHVAHAKAAGEEFSFMSSGISSERRVELAVEEVAWEMERSRRRGGRIVVVAGPVVVHTGAGRHVAGLIRMGYVQALLGGNAIAVHDIEQALFGTSLGVDLKRGVGVPGGHRHHLKAINLVRSHGGIANAVERGVITGGIMYECVRNGVPFALAGSIRDDGPLPETMMDLIRAQREYARLIEGADIVLMLCSMLHAIGTGNMTPSGVRLICVDISPAVVTKLADRGSLETVGIVTDVGLFLNLLVARLGGRTDGPV
jgi:lysine-ketoglutarate reductase/saccharopine dehydrogenase-like protein (TIGR00300 family)